MRKCKSVERGGRRRGREQCERRSGREGTKRDVMCFLRVYAKQKSCLYLWKGNGGEGKLGGVWGAQKMYEMCVIVLKKI